MIGSAARQLRPSGYFADVLRLSPFVFAATPPPADTTPDALSGETKSGQALSTLVTFTAVVPVGYNTATTIALSGAASGEYRVNAGAYGTAPGSLNPGDSFTVRNTSSASYLTAVDSVITLDGSVMGTYRSLTISNPADARYYRGGTAINGSGIMITSFLSDATPVPATAIRIRGIAHAGDGTRYVAAWPSTGVYYHGGIAVRQDGAMIIAASGTVSVRKNGIPLTYRGEVLVSTNLPVITHAGLRFDAAHNLCVTELA